MADELHTAIGRQFSIFDAGHHLYAKQWDMGMQPEQGCQRRLQLVEMKDTPRRYRRAGSAKAALATGSSPRSSAAVQSPVITCT